MARGKKKARREPTRRADPEADFAFRIPVGGNSAESLRQLLEGSGDDAGFTVHGMSDDGAAIEVTAHEQVARSIRSRMRTDRVTAGNAFYSYAKAKAGALDREGRELGERESALSAELVEIGFASGLIERASDPNDEGVNLTRLEDKETVELVVSDPLGVATMGRYAEARGVSKQRWFLDMAERIALDPSMVGSKAMHAISKWDDVGGPAPITVLTKDGGTFGMTPEGAAVALPVSRGDDSTLWMPTATLRRFSAKAREDGEDMALTYDEALRLHPAGRHVVFEARMQQRDGGHHYVRTRMGLAYKRTDEPVYSEDEVTERNVDLPLREFGLLMDGTQAQVQQHIDIADKVTLAGTGIVRPRWIGSHSFDRTWDECNSLATLAVWYERQAKAQTAEARRMRARGSKEYSDAARASHSTRALVAMETLELMQRAKVLSVDVDVFEGAPEWQSKAEMWAFAEQTRLPFDPLYLDLTTTGSLSPYIVLQPNSEGARPTPLNLRGAVMWHDGDQLNVTPIGWPRFADTLQASALGQGPSAFFGSDFFPLGRVRFGGITPTEPVEWTRMTPSGPGLDLSAMSPRVRPDIALAAPPLADLGNLVADPALRALRGRVEPVLGGGTPESLTLAEQYEQDHHAGVEEAACITWAHMTVAAAGRALSMLAMLEAVNVGIVDAKPTREEQRFAKRADKRGWDYEVATTVAVRPSKTQLREKPLAGDAPAREYSHAFWRRGHFAHYPLGTRMADKLAEENPQDTRLTMHPEKGLVRKVYRPAVVVGRTDGQGAERTVVQKTLVWRAERESKAAPITSASAAA